MSLEKEPLTRHEIERLVFTYHANYIIHALLVAKDRGQDQLSVGEVSKTIGEIYPKEKFLARVENVSRLSRSMAYLAKIGLLENFGLDVDQTRNRFDSHYGLTSFTEEQLSDRIKKEWLLSPPKNRLLATLDFVRRLTFQILQKK